MVGIKRVYDVPTRQDGKRILVDRLWPRGVKKDPKVVDDWMKEIAPSDDLRKWFSHDPAKWVEFKRRYKKELETKRELVEQLRRQARGGQLTLLYAAKDTEHNNAVVLKEIIAAR
ncbi:MAG TPA: DUF488 domain-containing protein [Syntrophorhabdales bacterium]|nr:DUF488 domain-containing protein [Syntrophorhabdales bacterium]